MEKNKKILLYQIDEQSKSVIFVVTGDTENEWKSITNDMRTVVSFDDVFKDITEFRESFLDYEKLTNELIGAINGRGEVFRDILSRFDDMRLKSFNFFTRYYSDTLRDIFTSTRDDIDRSGALFNTRALKKSTEYVNRVFNEIREVMRDDWNFDFNSESDLQTMKVSYTKIIVRGNDINEVYTAANTSLLSFFYDFSYSIHRLKLYICNCKYCNRTFLGAKNSICCDIADCQEKYQHYIKNEKRKAKENDTYNKQLTKLTRYLSQHTYLLKANVQEDMTYVESFKSRNAEFKGRMKAEIERCISENIVPGKEQEEFLKKLESEIFMYQIQLEEEWKSKQEKNY